MNKIEKIAAIKKYFGSVAAFSRKLEVSRAAIYRAINEEPYFKKLTKKIDKAIEKKGG